MGLDISVYSSLELVATKEEIEKKEASGELDQFSVDDYYDEYLFVFAHPDFPDQADHLVTGFYKADHEDGFRAGSYGGYSQFRRNLCKLALDCEPEVVWNNEEEYKGKPFFELICFSDAEGSIGPVTSGKLYQDFEEYAEKIVALLLDEQNNGEIEYFIERYENFKQAFYIAATKNGVVSFH